MMFEDTAAGHVEALASSTIGGDRALATRVQQRLSQAGLLEPPADGDFKAVSQWTMAEFMRKLGKPDQARLDAEVAHALLGRAELFSLKSTPTLAGRIAAAMSDHGRWSTCHPDSRRKGRRTR